MATKIECDLCDKKLSKSHIQKHRKKCLEKQTKNIVPVSSFNTGNVFDCSDCDSCKKAAIEIKIDKESNTRDEDVKQSDEPYTIIKTKFSKYYICTDCGAKTVTKQKIRWHGLMFHGYFKGDNIINPKYGIYFVPKKRKRGFECALCEETAMLKSYIEFHIAVAHKDTQKTVLTKIYEQRQFRTFRGRKSFKLPSIYLCVQCEVKVNKKSNMKNHLKQVHGYIMEENHDITCEICGYKTMASILGYTHHKKHLETHLNTPRKCNQCDFSSIHKKYLSDHMRIHKRKKWKCSVCQDFCGTSRKELNKHKKKKVKPCKVCNFKTHMRDELSTHKKMCIKKCKAKRKLQQNNLFCGICEIVCRGNMSLLRHQTKQHTVNLKKTVDAVNPIHDGGLALNQNGDLSELEEGEIVKVLE